LVLSPEIVNVKTRSLTVCAVGVGAALLMVLVPPWQLVTVHGYDFWAYSVLWMPPEVDPDSRRIDWARLLIQWTMVALVTAGLWMSLNWHRVLRPATLTVLWLGIGAAVLMGLCPPYASPPGEYGFLFKPPAGARGYINWTSLLIEWLITAIITLGLMLVLRRKSTHRP
jgi:hypothetical protein